MYAIHMYIYIYIYIYTKPHIMYIHKTVMGDMQFESRDVRTFYVLTS